MAKFNKGGLVGGFDQLRAPDAPTIGAATAGDTQVSVAFTAASDAGSGTVSSFAVRGVAGGASVSNTGTSSPIVVSSLTNGTEVTFSVVATSEFGVSPYSGTVAATPATFRRVVIAAGNDGTGSTNVMEFFDPKTTGNAADFGDLIAAASSMGGASSSTRGIFYGGDHNNSTMDFITINTTGNASDFGDIGSDFGRSDPASMASNGTIAVFAGGVSASTGNDVGRICKVTIASAGNTTDFTGDAGSVKITKDGADINSGSGTQGMINNTTRFIITGNSDGFSENSRYVNITLCNFDGDSQTSDFGDATISATERMGHSSSTRGLIAGGSTGSNSNVIEFITIASTGNASDFGDLTSARKLGAGSGDETTACFSGGGFSNVNIIDKVTIASAGNATDFGDLTRTVTRVSSVCNKHGGIA